MSEHVHAVTARRWFEAVSDGRADVLDEILSEDFIFHLPAGLPYSGTHRGRAGLMGAVSAFEQRGGSLHLEPDCILPGKQYVMAFIRATGEREGVRTQIRQAVGIKIDPDGKIEEVWFLPEHLKAWKAAFA